MLPTPLYLEVMLQQRATKTDSKAFNITIYNKQKYNKVFTNRIFCATPVLSDEIIRDLNAIDGFRHALWHQRKIPSRNMMSRDEACPQLIIFLNRKTYKMISRKTK